MDATEGLSMKSWLKFEKGGKSQLPSKLKRVHFKDPITEIITLLHSVARNTSSENFEFWMCKFILIVCGK